MKKKYGKIKKIGTKENGEGRRKYGKMTKDG